MLFLHELLEISPPYSTDFVFQKVTIWRYLIFLHIFIHERILYTQWTESKCKYVSRVHAAHWLPVDSIHYTCTKTNSQGLSIAILNWWYKSLATKITHLLFIKEKKKKVKVSNLKQLAEHFDQAFLLQSWTENQAVSTWKQSYAMDTLTMDYWNH